MQNIHVKVKHASVKKKLQSNAVRKSKKRQEKKNNRLKLLLKKQLLKLSQLPNQHRLLNQLQLRKHKIHVVKRHVQINHVIIVARMKMDLSKQEIISGIIKTK